MRELEIGIVYEDKSLLIVHKPAGLATESASVTQPDLLSELKNKKALPYVGLIHRLDQPVEGLLAVAKTKKAAAGLSSQLQTGKLKKSYLALALDERDLSGQAEGTGLEDKFELTDYLIKNPRTRRVQIADRSHKEAKKAILRGQILEHRQQSILLCRIEIETGRFHQIRAQMSHAGMPLLGDGKYGSDRASAVCRKLAIHSLCLCADRLELLHPVSGKRLEFTLRPSWAGAAL